MEKINQPTPGSSRSVGKGFRPMGLEGPQPGWGATNPNIGPVARTPAAENPSRYELNGTLENGDNAVQAQILDQVVSIIAGRKTSERGMLHDTFEIVLPGFRNGMREELAKDTNPENRPALEEALRITATDEFRTELRRRILAQKGASEQNVQSLIPTTVPPIKERAPTKGRGTGFREIALGSLAAAGSAAYDQHIFPRDEFVRLYPLASVEAERFSLEEPVSLTEIAQSLTYQTQPTELFGGRVVVPVDEYRPFEDPYKLNRELALATYGRLPEPGTATRSNTPPTNLDEAAQAALARLQESFLLTAQEGN